MDDVLVYGKKGDGDSRILEFRKDGTYEVVIKDGHVEVYEIEKEEITCRN